MYASNKDIDSDTKPQNKKQKTNAKNKTKQKSAGVGLCVTGHREKRNKKRRGLRVRDRCGR
jgi:hypothetical protein